MRILLLNQAYHPDPVATAQHAHDLALALAARGHEVSVIASRSVYGQAGAQLPKFEVEQGVQIHRIGQSLFGKKHVAGRILDFALFHLLSFGKILCLPRQDAVICLTTPPFIGLSALLATRLRGGHLVSWVMDLYPDVAVAGGLLKDGGLPHRLLASVTRFTLNRSARVVVLGRCMQQRVLALGVEKAQVVKIAPWAAEENGGSALADQAPRGSQKPTDSAKNITSANTPKTSGIPTPSWSAKADPPLIVMYSGNLGLAHDTGAFEKAMLVLKDHPQIRFVFSGGGKKRPQLEAFVAAHGLAQVSFLPYLLREQLAAQLSRADIHLISQAPAFTGLVIPSKLYGALAIGRGVAVVAPQDAEIAQVVREENCGRVFTPDETGGEALAAWLAQLADNRAEVAHLGQTARLGYLARHQRTVRLGEWVGLVEGLGAQA